MPDTPSTITDQLLKFARTTPPDDAQAMMRLSLLDWAACGIAGAQEDDFADFTRVHRGVGARAETRAGACAVFGGGTTGPAAAALVNGTLSHALDYDDTHFAHIGHPSVAVVPAVLALAQDVGASMEDVVIAATLGVEASILTGLWLGRDHYQIGYHQTATAGAFGATLATARLLGLDKAQMRHALGVCASMASGVKAQFGTMAKPLNAGLAARTGVEATLWAQAGMTAAADGLAGPLGFGATHHGAGGDVTPGKTPWHIVSISHKFHACCHGLHAMLEALREADLDLTRVEAIRIRTHPRWMSVCNIEVPKTGLEAKFSYAQTAAMALLGHDTGTIGSFTDVVTRDPHVVALRAKMRINEDPRLSETQAEVFVTLEGREMRRFRHDLMAPMALDVRAGKLRHKAQALVGDAVAGGLWEATQGDDLKAFADYISGT